MAMIKSSNLALMVVLSFCENAQGMCTIYTKLRVKLKRAATIANCNRPPE